MKFIKFSLKKISPNFSAMYHKWISFLEIYDLFKKIKLQIFVSSFLIS